MEINIKKYLREYLENVTNEEEFFDFIQEFKKSYGKIPNSDKILEELIKDIKKSPTSKINITNQSKYCGMSLNRGVILPTHIFMGSLYRFIFIVFHEIAHQYQYSKHGQKILYDLTVGDLSEEKLDKLIDIEQVADRFGRSMARKYGIMFNMNQFHNTSPYDNRKNAKEMYKHLLLMIQDKIKKGEITCVEEMENFLFNLFIK